MQVVKLNRTMFFRIATFLDAHTQRLKEMSRSTIVEDIARELGVRITVSQLKSIITEAGLSQYKHNPIEGSYGHMVQRVNRTEELLGAVDRKVNENVHELRSHVDNISLRLSKLEGQWGGMKDRLEKLVHLIQAEKVSRESL